MHQQHNKNFPLWTVLIGIGVLGLAGLLTVAIGVIIFVMGASDETPLENASALSQESTWHTYLYNQNDQYVLRVNADGTTHTTNLLPPMQGESDSVETVAVGGPVGSEVLAYCTSMVNGENYSHILNIVTVANGDLVQRHTLNDQLAQEQFSMCRVSLKGISPDGQTVAVSLVKIDEEHTFHWRLVLVDVATGTVVNEVNSDQANLSDSQNNRFQIMPDVRLYTEDRLAFAVIPWGTEGMPVDTAYVWDLNTGTLTQAPEWGNMVVDYFAITRELVWIEADANLPAGNPGGPIPSFNVVRLANDAGEVRTVYHDTEFLPIQVKFIDGGQALAIQVLQSIDVVNAEPGKQVTKWMRLDRNGNLTDLRDTTGAYVQIMPFKDSHLFLTQTYNNGTRTSLEFNRRGAVGVLWESTDNASYSIMKTSPIETNADLVAFTAIN